MSTACKCGRDLLECQRLGIELASLALEQQAGDRRGDRLEVDCCTALVAVGYLADLARVMLELFTEDSALGLREVASWSDEAIVLNNAGAVVEAAMGTAS